PYGIPGRRRRSELVGERTMTTEIPSLSICGRELVLPAPTPAIELCTLVTLFRANSDSRDSVWRKDRHPCRRDSQARGATGRGATGLTCARYTRGRQPGCL